MRTHELRRNIRQASIIAGAVVGLAGFLILLLTEQLQGMGDLFAKALIGMMLGAGIWFIVEQVAWHVNNRIKRRSQRKTRDQ